MADELHACGSTMTALRRLGMEYLRTVSSAGSAQTIWWYRSLLEVFSARTPGAMTDALAQAVERLSALASSGNG